MVVHIRSSTPLPYSRSYPLQPTTLLETTTVLLRHLHSHAIISQPTNQLAPLFEIDTQRSSPLYSFMITRVNSSERKALTRHILPPLSSTSNKKKKNRLFERKYPKKEITAMKESIVIAVLFCIQRNTTLVKYKSSSGSRCNIVIPYTLHR